MRIEVVEKVEETEVPFVLGGVYESSGGPYYRLLDTYVVVGDECRNEYVLASLGPSRTAYIYGTKDDVNRFVQTAKYVPDVKLVVTKEAK